MDTSSPAVPTETAADPPSRRLAGTACCLRCSKQIVVRRSFLQSAPAHWTLYPLFPVEKQVCLPVPKSFKSQAAELQIPAGAVKDEITPQGHLETAAKKYVAEVESYMRKKGASEREKRSSTGGALAGDAAETHRLLNRISLQLEQLVEVVCVAVSTSIDTLQFGPVREWRRNVNIMGGL
ncbi:hypothetical protein AJ79_06104 [Helicocarpus griseus UAMH5409]|uniref:Uncharacterized protein n=1 Tax=Helicocarpus griseus UAMH5409 TaxID=1447875 RepID=A0A2B7X8V4_9EURO|nr:hypothetical protein AJ79_06104 [Helicocarpus griseus UAMH5409]